MISRAGPSPPRRYTQPDPIGLTSGLNLFAYVDDNPANWSDPRGLKVFRRCRDIQVNVIMNGVARLMGFKHCFLKTDSIEAGMGPADNGPLPTCPIGVQTAVTNHKGQSQSSETQCTEVKDVNEKCVNDELGVGRPLGRWIHGISATASRTTCCGAARNVRRLSRHHLLAITERDTSDGAGDESFRYALARDYRVGGRLHVDGQPHAFQLVGSGWPTDAKSAAVRNAGEHLRSRNAAALRCSRRTGSVQLAATRTMNSFTASAWVRLSRWPAPRMT